MKIILDPIYVKLEFQLEQVNDLLAWAYSKLYDSNFRNVEDALKLDEIKLVLTGAYDEE